MIKETHIKDILAKHIPEMKIATEQQKSLYQTIASFATYTKELIKQGNIPLIRDCFNTAEYLLVEGGPNIKLAMENIYVFSVTAFMDLTGAVSKQAKELLPAHLKAAYRNQTYF